MFQLISTVCSLAAAALNLAMVILLYKWYRPKSDKK